MPPTAKAEAIPIDAPIAILHGPERFIQLDLTDVLRAALTKKHGEINSLAFDGSSARPADILDECRSMSLMMQHKCIVVENAETMLAVKDEDEDAPAASQGARRRPGEKTAREMFETYAASPDASTTLILRAATWRPSNIDKAVIKSGGVVIKCEPYSDSEAVQWVRRRAPERHHHPIAPDAAQALIAAVGTDLGRLDSELAKLSLAVEGGKTADAPITAETVRALCGFSREEEVWSIQRGLMAGDAAAALRNLHQALDVSRHSPVLVGIAYLDLARKLDGVARGLAAREAPPAIFSRVKLWGSSGEAVMAAARRLRPSATADLFQAAVDADRRQKSGQGDPVHILEGLTLRFASVLG